MYSYNKLLKGRVVYLGTTFFHTHLIKPIYLELQKVLSAKFTVHNRVSAVINIAVIYLF